MTGPAPVVRANFRLLRDGPQRVDRYNYVAEKLSGLSPTYGKEKPYGYGALPLRQVRLEGLALPTELAQGGNSRS